MSFNISTSRSCELIDITQSVIGEVETSGIKDGIVLVYVPHATAAVIVNENERGLVADMKKSFLNMIPSDADYEHDVIDDNAAAHLASAVLGCSVTMPITQGRIERGTWQNIFLVEFDGPRNRKVIVKTIGK